MHEDSNLAGRISLRSLFFSPSTVRQIPREVSEQIEQLGKECRAIAFYLRSLLNKVFSALREREQNRIDMLAIAYQKFQEGITASKAERITIQFKRKVMLKLRSNRQLRFHKKQEKQMQLRAYQTAKANSIFRQWAKITKIEKSQRLLLKKRRDEMGKELLMLLKENLDRKIMKKLSVHGEGISQFYAKKIVKMAFQGFVINLKIWKLQNNLRIYYFPLLIEKVTGYNKQSKKCIQIRQKYLIKNCFSSWKTEYKTAKADLFHQRTLIRNCFLHWRSLLDIFVSENQIQKENNRIVTLFRDRCENNKIRLIFSRWKEISQEGKRWRRENSILNRCALAKYIETLLRKYFEKLKAHRLFSKIRSNYYEVRLKRKALDSFKFLLIASAEREEKLFAFLQRRTLSKYFSRIKRFNQQQTQKIIRFTKLRAFKAFTFTIVYQYFLRKKKADTYHTQNLLFKSLFALKNQRAQRIKEELCILTINLALPLRRWYKNYQIRNYLIRKNWLRAKSIIRQWKLLIISRHSNEQLVRQFRAQESGVKAEEEETFEFQNILATIAKIRKNFMLEKSANESNVPKLNQ